MSRVHLLHYSDIENATDHPRRVGRLAGCIEARRRASTLVCGTGDTLAPAVLADESGGTHVLPLFEAISPDFSTVGNHDFDVGRDALERVIAESPQRWLAANLRTDGRPFAADAGVRPAAVTPVGDATVGLVGVTDPETVGGHEAAVGLTATDPVGAVADAVADFSDHAVDATVVLSHAGRRDDRIAALEGVDLVLGGHDHERRTDAVDGTPVVHPGERGDVVAAVELDVSAGSVEPTTTALHDVTEAPVATGVADEYRDIHRRLGLDETVTRVAAPVTRHRSDRYPESAVGNFVADAVRRAADADVAVVHPGTLRSGPPLDGDVSVGDVRACTPFDNELYTTRLDGDELAALFESFAFPEPLAELDIGPEVYGHVSGARLSWRRGEGRLELVDAAIGDGRPAADATYTVAAPAFEFDSDLYPVLEPGRADGPHGRQHDALVDHARERGVDPSPSKRMRLLEDAAPGSLLSLR